MSVDETTMERGRRRAAVIDGWACFGHLNRCREPGCEGTPTCVIVYRVGDDLGVTTLCLEHEIAAKEVLRERPRVQVEQTRHDSLAGVMPGGKASR
jgi:hypothetical protein